MKKHKNLLCWIYGLCFVIVWLFPGRALSQTNSPLKPYRNSFDTCGHYYIKAQNRTMRMLRAPDYPWGVCHSYYDDFSEKEREWTKEAMQIWNAGFSIYRWNMFKTHDVVNIPTGDLFVESCDSDNRNILYTKKKYLEDKVLGYYSAQDWWLDFSYFHGVIVMNSGIELTKAYFINVMVHELGHALGLPHAQAGMSDLMIPKGFGCKNYYIDRICNLTDYDFETFIEPFPGIPQTRVAKEKDEKEHAKFIRYVNDRCKGSRACGADMGINQ